MAEDIQATTPIINPVFGDAAVRAPLIPRGFDTRNLNDARLLCDAAQTKWDDRQAAIAQQTEKTQQGVDLFDTAVQSLGDFRESIRTVINATASLQARGCTEPVPEDLQKFITHAKSTYTAARKEAYAAPAAKKGYNAAALDEELKALETLRTTEEEQRGG